METKSDKENKKNEEGQKGGFTFHGPVEGNTQTFIEGDVNQLNISSGLSAEQRDQLDTLIQPVKEQLKAAPPDQRQPAEEKMNDLKTELTKGHNANADRLNKIIDSLLDLVPGALSALVTMFANPILGALVGPVTKSILDRLHTK